MSILLQLEREKEAGEKDKSYPVIFPVHKICFIGKKLDP